MVTEHSLPKNKKAGFEHYVSQEGKKARCSPTVPKQGANPLGGVASITNAARRVIELTPKTEAFAQAYKKGRMGIYAVNLTESKTLTYVIIYGHTGGRIGPKEAAATNILIQIAHAEMEAQPKGPKVIAGDLNADPTNLPHLQDMVNDQGWTDLGAKANLWGGIPEEHTCLGHNAKDSTRNDYALANSHCLPLVKGLRVLHHECFLVHSVLQFKLEGSTVVTAYQAPKKPKSLYELLRNKCLEKWKEEDPTKAEDAEEQNSPEKVWMETESSVHQVFDDQLKIR